MPFSLGSKIALKNKTLSRRRGYGFTTYNDHAMPAGDLGFGDGIIGPLFGWPYGTPTPRGAGEYVDHPIFELDDVIDTFFITNGAKYYCSDEGDCTTSCYESINPKCCSLCADPFSVCPAECDSVDPSERCCLHRHTPGRAGAWGVRFEIGDYTRNNQTLRYKIESGYAVEGTVLYRTVLYDGEEDIATITVVPPFSDQGYSGVRLQDICPANSYSCTSCGDCSSNTLGDSAYITINIPEGVDGVTATINGYNVGPYALELTRWLWSNEGFGWDSLTGSNEWREYYRTSYYSICDSVSCSSQTIPEDAVGGQNRIIAVMVNPDEPSLLPGDNQGPPAGYNPENGWVAAKLDGSCFGYRALTIDFNEQYELMGATHPWAAQYSADKFTIFYTPAFDPDGDCTNTGINPENYDHLRVEYDLSRDYPIPSGGMTNIVNNLRSDYDYIQVGFWDNEYTESQPGGSPNGGYYTFGITTGASADFTLVDVGNPRTAKWEWYDGNEAGYSAAAENLLPEFHEGVWPDLADAGLFGTYIWANITGGNV